MGAPQVNYRESISRQNDIRYVHKKQSGGSGQFAGVCVCLCLVCRLFVCVLSAVF